MSDQTNTAGVQELIDRLSQEGVIEGQRQAEKILSDAQQAADDILDSARQQANEILEQAKREAAQYQAAGEEALRLAARDAVRDFGAKIHQGLRQRLQDLVHRQLEDPGLISQMILAIVRRATDGLGDAAVEILIPENIVSETELRERIESGDQDALTEFVQGLIGEDLREGFTTGLGSRKQDGLTVRVRNENVEIDLTDEAITEHLAQHLLPRFRAIMRSS